MKKNVLLMVFVFCFALVACGKKGDPLPQKVDKLFSLQDVFASVNPEGTLTVMGTVIGAKQNVQSFTLELEAVDEDCIGCPFVPAERYTKTPAETIVNTRTGEFSITVLPATKSSVYRWRIVARNSVSGLPSAVTPVFKVNKPFEDKRDFIELTPKKD